MQYAKILAALDIEIDRLQRARDLLAGLPPSRKKLSKRTYPALKKEIRIAKLEAAVSLPPEQSPPQIQKVPYKERAKPRRHRNSSKTLISSTALSSQVPAAPVVVSADEAQKARVRETEQTRSTQLAPTSNNHSTEKSLGSLIRALTRGRIPAEL
jgi:hypothetical protein